jgi:hypothetical protein
MCKILARILIIMGFLFPTHITKENLKTGFQLIVKECFQVVLRNPSYFEVCQFQFSVTSAEALIYL